MGSRIHKELLVDYFEKIDDINKAYWLGFLYADGYVAKNESSLVLELSKKDEDLVKDFCKCIKANQESIKQVNRGPHISCKILISSKEFVRHLIDKGCVNKKSLTIRLPELNSEELNLSFLMGYFDGDGDGTSTALYSGSKEFLNDIKVKYEIESDVKMKRTVYFLNLGADLKRKMMASYPNSLPRKRRTYINDKGFKIKNPEFLKEDRPEKRKFNVTKEELSSLLKNNSFVKMGEMFGVSDNAIRKRAKRLGII